MAFNYDLLAQIIELTDQGAEALGGAAEFVGSAKRLLKSPERPSDADIKAALADVTEKLADAKMANGALKLALAEAHEQLMKLKATQDRLSRYALHETAAGDIVLMLKSPADTGEPLHYICPKCAEDGVVSILQGAGRSKDCFACGASCSFKPFEAPTRRNVGGWSA